MHLMQLHVLHLLAADYGMTVTLTFDESLGAQGAEDLGACPATTWEPAATVTVVCANY